MGKKEWGMGERWGRGNYVGRGKTRDSYGLKTGLFFINEKRTPNTETVNTAIRAVLFHMADHLWLDLALNSR